MYQTSNIKGQEVVAQGMVKGFKKLGHKAYLITSCFHDGERIVSEKAYDQSQYLFRVDDKLDIPVIRVNGYPASWPPRRIMLGDFVGVLKEVVRKFGLNVLIAHSTLWNGVEDAAKFVSWRRTACKLDVNCRKLVYCYMPHFQPPDPIRYAPIERAYRKSWNNSFLPLIFKTSDLILHCTPIIKQRLERLGAESDKFLLFPGGVDKEIFIRYQDVDFRAFCENYHLPQDVKVISYLGAIDERKNPMSVVEVAKRLRHVKDAHFVIAGAPSTQHGKVRRESKRLDNVTYIGRITQKEKVQLIKGSFLNILMSRAEALGLTQLEFMYGGVPVISSAVGGQRWLIKNTVNGLCVNGPYDFEGAERAIMRLLENPQEREKMSKKAKAFSQKFVRSNLIQGLEQNLRLLVDSEWL